jgi:hypothetical protein
VETQQYLASKVTLVDVKLDSSPKRVDLPFPAHVIYLYSYTDVDPGYVYIAKSQQERPIRLTNIKGLVLGTPTDELYVSFDPQAITGPNPQITLAVAYNASLDQLENISGGMLSPATPYTYILPAVTSSDVFTPLTYDPSQAAVSITFPPSRPTTETEMIRTYVLLYTSTRQRTLAAHVLLTGNGYIYVDTVAGTYYYRYYIALAKTSDFVSFTSITDEVKAMDYSRSQASTANWYTEGNVFGVVRAITTLYPGENLVLRIRATSWCPHGGASNIGINSSTLKLHTAIFF